MLDVNCNLCGSNETKTLFPHDFSYVVKCKKCGLVYRNPRPSEDEILKQIVSDGIDAQRKKIVWYDSKIKLFKKNLKRIEKYFSKGKLLDVGCGYGTFLKIAEDDGWQVQGIEISRSASDYAKTKLGLNISKETLKEAHFSDNYFDVITLWEVLGALYNPSAELQEVKRILKEGGLIALRLHNATFHIFIHRFFRFLGNLDVKLNLKPTIFHFYSFSPKTIRKILEKVGFVDIKVMPSELTERDPYSTGGVFGPFGITLIKKIVFSLSRLIFYLTAGSLVLAPSILVFAKKPLNDSEEGDVKNLGIAYYYQA